MKYISYYDSPLGRLTMVSDEEALTHLLYTHQIASEKAIGKEFECKETPAIKRTKEWLDLYFSGKEPKFHPPMKMEGTAFQKQVWEILCKIPYGQCTTYGAIAKEIARTNGVAHMSSQAVGGAVGHNPIAIIVPCHRVIGTDGSLTGYAGGLQRKTKLLDLEKKDYRELRKEKLIQKLDNHRAQAMRASAVTV